MSTPVKELPKLSFTSQKSELAEPDDEDSHSGAHQSSNPTIDDNASKHNGGHTLQTQSKEEERCLDDELAMLQAERVVSQAQSSRPTGRNLNESTSTRRSRSRHEPIEEFDADINSVHEKVAASKPDVNPSGRVARAIKSIHDSSFLVRYFSYIVPLAILILFPLLIGALMYKRASIGGVRLMWFSVWLEVVWLTLWGGRIVARFMPVPVGLVSSLCKSNSKKWRDMCKQLEVPATLFLWTLSAEVSFLPIMMNNHVDGTKTIRKWEATMNKIIISLLIGAAVNFLEKIIIQLIAISFHLRAYADRIEINKFQTNSLTKLYQYSKERIEMDDSEFEGGNQSGPSSGARTPMQMLDIASKTARSGLRKVGDVAGKVAGDFTGKQVTKSTHPRQVVLTLLSSAPGSQVLARRLYRTFSPEEADTISSEDLKNAFDNDEEANDAFSMFDKDLNGDISMSELEAVCVEIGRERKSITAALKDLDSVVSKLDSILLFVVLIITILVFVSLISSSAAGVLAGAGSAVLALSWLFSGTAQELLASCIFVLVKHPYDVGDRVYLYGNAGATMKGDDYFVKKISLLYTEFKKMEGQVVQVQNSILDRLFILNQRRSGGLAEAVPLVVKFGTTLDEIEALRQRLLEFVKSEKREFQPSVWTEIRDIIEVHSVTLNVVFFYKSNWQNELLRLQRRNKFICAMMISMQEIGIEGPRMRLPGQTGRTPFYQHNLNYPDGQSNGLTNDGNGSWSQSGSLVRENAIVPQVLQDSDSPPSRSSPRQPSITSRTLRDQGESITAMSKRVDFSLGMKDVSSGALMDDLYENSSPVRAAHINRDLKSRAESSRRFILKENEGLQETPLRRSTSRTSDTLRRFGFSHASPESPKIVRSSHSVIHRNRFFSRREKKENQDGECDDLMEQGMADIPESSMPFADSDPNGSVVSPQAVRKNATFESPGVCPSTPGNAGEIGQESDLRKVRSRSNTEAFEMRPMNR